MGMVPTVRSVETLVDGRIGSAYPVVRRVEQSLQEIRYLAHNLESIEELSVLAPVVAVQVQVVTDAVSAAQIALSSTEQALLETIENKELVDQAVLVALAAKVQAGQAVVAAQQEVINAANASRLTVGTVSTGTAGATITGNAGNQEINFVVPAGSPGTPGLPGVKGDPGNPGATGPAPSIAIGSVITSSTEAAVTINGNPTDGYVLNLTLPKGEPGDPTAAPVEYQSKFEEVSDTVILRGWSLPGTADNDPTWKIQKILLNQDDTVTKTWANGTDSLVHVWDDRSTYTYS